MAKVMHVSIPVSCEVVRLNEIFRSNGFDLCIVGGAIRDFLISDEEGRDFMPKDVDLATDATPAQISQVLDRAGVRNFEKGESFGVWVAHMNGMDFEIATFRTDGEYKDGRRPDEVEWATAEQDYKRRDLTINALYYRLPFGSEPSTVIDYGDGVGFDDLKERRVRSVGDPRRRFSEDKLRVLRAVRFHHRFNDDYIANKVEFNFIKALREFSELRKHGISGPRIMAEFLTCVKQAKSLKSLVFDLGWLKLFDEIFPGLAVETSFVETLDEVGEIDPVVLIAWLMRYTPPHEVRDALRSLNYPGDVFDDVEFLLNVKPLLVISPSSDPVEDRDKKLTLASINLFKNDHRYSQLKQFCVALSSYFSFDEHEANHLLAYKPKFYDGFEIMERYSVKGPELGERIRNLQTEDYRQSRRLYQG